MPRSSLEDDIETIDDLFNGKQKFIHAKKEILDQSFPLAGKPKDVAVEPGKPYKIRGEYAEQGVV
jgi:hypothetical protein